MRLFQKSGTLIACLTLLFVARREDALLVPFHKWVSTSNRFAKAHKVKVAIAITAIICNCGLPTPSFAAETVSLEKQLKILQDIKVANQKRRIEAAEFELQSKELLYPEGRLIGRGIVKLMPESGDE